MEKVYCKNTGIQTIIDESMIHICQDEGASPKQVFLLFFAVGFIVMGYLNRNFCVCEAQLIFSGDKGKNLVEFFDARILR